MQLLIRTNINHFNLVSNLFQYVCTKLNTEKYVITDCIILTNHLKKYSKNKRMSGGRYCPSVQKSFSTANENLMHFVIYTL